MTERRIKLPRDKAELVKRLRFLEDVNPKGVFRQYSEMMAFCAMLGYKYDRYVPFDIAIKDIDPIRFDVFVRGGYDKLFYLIALVKTNDPECMSRSEEAEEKRASIFEAYTNGGLCILQEKLHGIDDPLDYMLLMIRSEFHD